MNLPQRINLCSRLGQYLTGHDDEWLAIKERAARENGWFTPEFIDLACMQIAENYLTKPILEKWTKEAFIPNERNYRRKVGIVMAGNIPLVGFHDWLCVFIAGHDAMIKTSSKDAILLPHLLRKIEQWQSESGDDAHGINAPVPSGEMLKGCDAYIATGSNNSAGYFDYYFRKYPHIIRRNRTSVAIIRGDETPDELSLLADDVFQYFGLGCRNVTKLFAPQHYDFIPLLTAFKKYNYLGEHNKYRNNYDYNLAILLLNKIVYMSTEALLLVEDSQAFSPISQLNYEFYADRDPLLTRLATDKDIQCVVGSALIPFGNAQRPRIDDYADGVNTLEFLNAI